jgi:hypothetical protein
VDPVGLELLDADGEPVRILQSPFALASSRLSSRAVYTVATAAVSALAAPAGVAAAAVEPVVTPIDVLVYQAQQPLIAA